MTSCFTKKKSIWIWTMSSTPSGPLKIAKHKACREHSCYLPMRFTLVNQPDWPKKPGLSAQTLYKQEGNWSSPGTQWLTLVSNQFGYHQNWMCRDFQWKGSLDYYLVALETLKGSSIGRYGSLIKAIHECLVFWYQKYKIHVVFECGINWFLLWFSILDWDA